MINNYTMVSIELMGNVKRTMSVDYVILIFNCIYIRDESGTDFRLASLSYLLHIDVFKTSTEF
jgi:hypothetical protein